MEKAAGEVLRQGIPFLRRETILSGEDLTFPARIHPPRRGLDNYGEVPSFFSVEWSSAGWFDHWREGERMRERGGWEGGREDEVERGGCEGGREMRERDGCEGGNLTCFKVLELDRWAGVLMG